MNIVLPPIAKEEGPWFTGPILTPSGNIAPFGFIEIEAYLGEFIYTGIYDKNWNAVSTPNFYSLNPFFYFEAGLTKFMSMSISPQFYYQETRGESDVVFGDLPVAVYFQLATEEKDSWHPSLKLALKEIFPTGPYQELDPKKFGTDLGGAGSFITAIGLDVSKVVHLFSRYYLNARASFSIEVPSSLHVKGINFYGGGPDTKGKVVPGVFTIANIGLELSLTKNWVLALDIENNYYNKTKFSGTMGILAGTNPVFMRLSSANQISLAPAVEYNFSEKLGLIAGSWFTVAGRNTSRFASGIIALNYYTSVK